MINFGIFLALLLGGMAVVQPAAGRVLADLMVRMDFDANAFQPRQTNNAIPPVPPQCASICDPINPIVASGVSHATR
jgi:hypothetical protein